MSGEEASRSRIYSDVARIITGYWGPRELGLRNATVAFSARKKPGMGAPGPIQILSFLPILAGVAPVPNRRDFTLSRLRRPKDSDLKSVYQAHAQGVAQTTAGSLGHSLRGHRL